MKLKLLFTSILLASLLFFLIEHFTKKETVKGKTFVIARDSGLHPVDLMGKEVDIKIICDTLLSQIASDQGFTIQIKTVQNDQLLPGLKSKDYDGILTPVVEKWNDFGQYYFSQPIFALGPVLIVRLDQKDLPYSSFKGKTIGILRNSLLMNRLSSIPDINIQPFDKMADGLDYLMENRIEGFILDALPAYLYTEGFYKGKLVIHPTTLSSGGIKLVTLQTPSNQQFIDSFNQGFINLVKNNFYQNLLGQWEFPDYPLPPLQSDTPALLDDTTHK